MMRHSRVSSSLDVNRLGQALRRPGLDTRTWVSLAVVKKFVLDPDEGPFADVVLLPSQDEMTVHVGSFYAGPGFGFYAPLEADDEVVVEFPDGDPDLGGVIVARTWSKSDPPPSTAKDHDADVCLHLKDGVNLRIAVTGSGKVLLGDTSGETRAVARETDPLTASAAFKTWAAAVDAGIPTLTPPPTPFATAAGLAGGMGKIESGSSKVEASD